jgi:hypothetical protein
MKECILRYTGKKRIVTLNELKSKWAWMNAKKYYNWEFIELLRREKVGKYEAFSLTLSYNSKHDCDNMAGVAKFFVDTFRELKHVKNDSEGYYKSLTLRPDKSLPKWTIEFKITPEKYVGDKS